MLILHGSWIPKYTPGAAQPGVMALWGEIAATHSPPARRRRGAPGEGATGAVPVGAARPVVQRHPFSTTGSKLRDALKALDVPQVGSADCCTILAHLPCASPGGAPLPSQQGIRVSDDANGSGVSPALTLAAYAVEALTCEAAQAPQWLLSLADEAPLGVLLGEDILFWIAATRLTLELVYRQRLIPTLQRESVGAGGAGAGLVPPSYVARWRLLLDQDEDLRRLNLLAAAMPTACRALTWEAGTSRDVRAPAAGSRHLLLSYMNTVADALPRISGAGVAGAIGSLRSLRSLPAKSRKKAAGATGAGGKAEPRTTRTIAEAWIEALHGDPKLQGDPQELAGFYEQYRSWIAPPGQATASADAAGGFRVLFRLDPPPTEPLLTEPFLTDPDAAGVPGDPGVARPVTPGAGTPDWTLHYLLQATDDLSLQVPAAHVWQQRGKMARLLDRKLDQPQERLLSALGLASRLFPPIEASLRTARPEMCRLTTSQAYTFVRETALLLQSSGFGVQVPGLETRLGVRVRLGSPGSRKDNSKSSASVLTWDSLVNYDWEVALGGETLSRAEFEQLARLKEPLVQVRGQWVELRPDLIEQALALFERKGDGGISENGGLPVVEAIRMALAPGEGVVSGLPVVEVSTEGLFDELMHQLRDGAKREEVGEPPGFQGELRAYQKTGVAWLLSLRNHRLGACLADDMGLGKTIQIIALLLHERDKGTLTGPSLLVCPTSVVGNWRRELTRFAPSLRVMVHHGAGRNRETFGDDARGHDVVISTYALLYRDEAPMLRVDWDAVVLDEAQNIKNPSTKGAQSARKLRTRWRAALTGTPVENRLQELWSILNFLNPGFLGSAEEFRKEFANPIERAGSSAATDKLKTLVAPFILRRLKTDRSIISDLPEKNEMKLYCTLTREQATLYQAVLKDGLRAVEESEGIGRRGQILAMLTKLKQVCNHPALFLHDGSAVEGRSGKLDRLGEMLEEALSVGDRALVFTQYAQMGKMLKEHLEALFGREVLFLHGGTRLSERDLMVTRFQGDGRGAPSIFVLSLKAGGVGLNLTHANHVFHFDRWWNPAVENQATDRAFRIGQRRDVQVHKFICAGTFEEALDEIIERKKALSQAIVGAGEAWITEMSTKELRDLFALRHDAVE